MTDALRRLNFFSIFAYCYTSTDWQERMFHLPQTRDFQRRVEHNDVGSAGTHFGTDGKNKACALFFPYDAKRFDLPPDIKGWLNDNIYESIFFICGYTYSCSITFYFNTSLICSLPWSWATQNPSGELFPPSGPATPAFEWGVRQGTSHRFAKKESDINHEMIRKWHQ